jgi:predicted  nucleic acid-binding Zn-ribbon protein
VVRQSDIPRGADRSSHACPTAAVKETTLKEVGEMLGYVVEHMVTKEDIAEIRAEMATKKDLTKYATKDDVRTIISEEIRPIHAELADIRRDLDDLRSRVANIAGYGKEIDHALERIAAIEKHLGIGRKAAA